jgi:hypothetical protein
LRPAPRSSLTLTAALLASACTRVDPPGRSVDVAPEPLGLRAPSELDAAPAPAEPAGGDPDEPGHGAKIASIAMRTWIYVAPDDRSTKLGYLRAGAVVDRAERPAGTTTCEGGWYRVAPRGYVCVGKGASLDLEHDVVKAAARGPDRDGTLPYLYVLSGSPPPHLYFRLPTEADQRRVEGSTLDVHLARTLHVVEKAAGEPEPVPAFLAAGKALPKPYGADKRLHYSVHSGRAKESSAFGLMTTFAWTDRRFGLTTELDLIPLDRTKIARPSRLFGLVVTGEGTPALVKVYGVVKLVPDGAGGYRKEGVAPFRSGWVLTGRNNGSPGGLLETTEGVWLPAETLAIPEPRRDPSGFAEAGRKWIDVSIQKQLLVAYEGTRPVFATLVSTGRGKMSDPETTTATVRGVFRIRAKHVSATMDGEEGSDAFDLRDVPYIQYFHEGYALHGAYWHDEFGKVRSHGCVNLAPADAAWLFRWTDPEVPAEWHGAVNPEGGTLVYIHG